ncbi:helix-turn-helix domain-containing protein [Limosilactobacillus fermentum]|uniref:helix-turn-helix domain-containing protein n=1 Tax=Limosilactobacillus fermentum TaxID=1613 RepID=UPI0035574372
MEIALTEQDLLSLAKKVAPLIKPEKEAPVKEYFNKSEAAKYIGVSRSTLDRMIQKGLPVCKFEGSYILMKKKIDDWITSQM